MIAIHYLQSKSILPQLLSQQDKRANFELYSGPVDRMLSKDKTVIADERLIAEWRAQLPHDLKWMIAKSEEIRNSRSKREGVTLKKGSGGPQNISDSSRSSNQVPEYKSIQERLEAVMGCRVTLTDFEKELAKVRNFDKSPSPLPVSLLLLTFSTALRISSRYGKPNSPSPRTLDGVTRAYFLQTLLPDWPFETHLCCSVTEVAIGCLPFSTNLAVYLVNIFRFRKLKKETKTPLSAR